MDSPDSRTRLERRVVRDFPEPGSAQEIMRILEGLPDTIHYSRDPLDRERIRAAIIILAGRKVGRFVQAVEGAKIDWRDVLVAAGLGDKDWPARLDEALGPEDAGHRAAQEE